MTETRTSRRRGYTARVAWPLKTLTLAWVAFLVPAGAAMAQDNGGALFTAEQVARGDRIFTIECGGCHGPTLTEVLAETETAYRFYAHISGTMPWENPGALTRQQYADIVAFMLSELGFPAGEAELEPDRELLSLIVPANVPAPLATATDAAGDTLEDTAAGAALVAADDAPQDTATAGAPDEGAPSETSGGTGFFTVEQADQGIRDFAIACGNCHGPDMVEIFQTYDTVADYFSYITGAMPNDDPGNLPMRQYLSVVAQLLRESGFPAGDAELTRDIELMRSLIPAEPPTN